MQDPGLEAEALTHNEMLQVRDQLYDLERQLNSASRGEGEEVGADGRKAEQPVVVPAATNDPVGAGDRTAGQSVVVPAATNDPEAPARLGLAQVRTGEEDDENEEKDGKSESEILMSRRLHPLFEVSEFSIPRFPNLLARSTK